MTKPLTLATLMLALTAILAGCGGREPAVVDGIATSSDGTPIHYTLRGAGSPTLVFVHGWSCDGTYWQDQLDHFAPTHRVVAIDLAGHGESSEVRQDYTMESFGQDVVAVLKQLDVSDAILIGHSMGGAVITEAALAAPERVRGLIGVDNFQQLSFGLTDAQIAGFVEALTADFAGTVVPWVGSMFPADADSTLKAFIVQDMAAGSPAVGASAMGHLLSWYNTRAAERLAELKVPLMCINADRQPTDEAALKSVVPGYQVRYMPGRGHFLMREDPTGFNRLLAETVGAILH